MSKTMCSELFEAINLDGFTQVEDVQEMARVFGLLSCYAEAKANAIRMRLRGDIEAARSFEKNCEYTYGDLPVWAKW